MYRLLFFQSRALVRDKKKLLKDTRATFFIQEALGRLALNPFAAFLAVKKLRDAKEGIFRLRCGSWRILYDLDTENKNIIVYRIMQRKEGY